MDADVKHLQAQLITARSDRDRLFALLERTRRDLKDIARQRNMIAQALANVCGNGNGLDRGTWQAMADLHEAGCIAALDVWNGLQAYLAEIEEINA